MKQSGSTKTSTSRNPKGVSGRGEVLSGFINETRATAAQKRSEAIERANAALSSNDEKTYYTERAKASYYDAVENVKALEQQDTLHELANNLSYPSYKERAKIWEEKYNKIRKANKDWHLIYNS